MMKGAKTHGPRIRFTDMEDKVVVPRGYTVRRAQLGHDDFQKMGYTIGCPGCAWLQLGMGPRRNHTEECRQRMYRELQGTEEGRPRIERAEARRNRWSRPAETQQEEGGKGPKLPHADETD